MARPRKNTNTNTPNRPKRNEFGNFARNLSYNDKDPAFVYRVFNDKDDRIQLAMENGYEVVQSDQELGDPTAGSATKLGSVVTKPVGGGMNGVLMRIPKKEYEEAQQLKQAYVDKTEGSLRDKAKQDGHYGSMKQESSR